MKMILQKKDLYLPTYGHELKFKMNDSLIAVYYIEITLDNEKNICIKNNKYFTQGGAQFFDWVGQTKFVVKNFTTL